MSGVGNVLEIARRALFAQQAALDTTGHNIANANTEGYSRQRAQIRADTPIILNSLKFGTGADISAIERVRDRYIDSQLDAQKQSLAWWETIETKNALLEEVFGEPSEAGLSAIMNRFFDSWQDLANDPDSASERERLRYVGNSLTRKFNEISDRIESLQNEITIEFKELISEFNALFEKIRSLNQKFTSSNPMGGVSGDLLDERDRILSRMNEIANIQTVYSDNGQAIVSLGGKVFIDKSHVIEIDTDSSEMDFNYLIWDDGTRTNRANNGELGALAETKLNAIPQVLSNLDDLAESIVENVNSVHFNGYGLDGSTGNYFFSASGTSASSIQLDLSIQENSDKIVSSSDEMSGNGDVALEISQLQDVKILTDQTATFNDFYGGMISTIGFMKQEASTQKEGQMLFVNQIEQYQQSYSGVSLDEEMANMIKFQRAYQAAAKLVTTADEMAETVLSMV